MLKKILLLSAMSIGLNAVCQPPCGSNPMCRQFDFWIGEWEVYAPSGQKAGESSVQLMLDSCILLENWKSASGKYAGKSFNLYNTRLGQWQQTWVDDKGGIMEFFGHWENNCMRITTKPFEVKPDTVGIRRMSFYKLDANKVRQHGEVSIDDGIHWQTEYDLEYRRRVH